MVYEQLKLEVDGPVARLTLDRPQVRNALSRTLLRELITAAAELDAATGVRVVVVCGAGPSFCAGADLADLAAALVDTDPDERTAAADLGRRMADAVEGMRAVTIARLHGHVVGGGAVLAAACDLRVADPGTTVRIPEVDIGLPLGWGGLHRLVRDVGVMRTKELVMTGRPVGADEACTLGLVTSVADDGALDVAIDRLVQTLLAKPWRPVRRTKREIADLLAGQTPQEAADAGTAALLDAVTSDDFQDLLASYLAQRDVR